MGILICSLQNNFMRKCLFMLTSYSCRHRWSKVDSLQKKKEEIMAKVESKTEDTEGDSDIDEQEFEEFLDWRTKKAWK